MQAHFCLLQVTAARDEAMSRALTSQAEARQKGNALQHLQQTTHAKETALQAEIEALKQEGALMMNGHTHTHTHDDEWRLCADTHWVSRLS